MKHSILLALFFAALLTSCDSSTEPVTDGNSLVMSADTIFLTKAEPTKMLDLTLSCGCMFTAEVTSLYGDTKAIETTPLESLSERSYKHTIAFQYHSSRTTEGNPSLRLYFLAKKSPYSYTKSVIVKVVE